MYMRDLSAISTLILDLDDTIFPTRSISPAHFRELFDSMEFEKYGYSGTTTRQIIADLWRLPMADVAQMYKFPEELVRRYHTTASRTDFQFDISPYADYSHLLKLTYHRHLVTTGTTPVQEKKIDALGIRGDFGRIIINDPYIFDGGKLHCFETILREEKLEREEVLVIGDNPDSEIAAAIQANLPYLIIDRSLNAPDFDNKRISSFTDLT